MTTKYPLLPALSSFNTPILTQFFRVTLEIPNLSWENLIEELGAIKKKSKVDARNVEDIYQRLQKMSVDLSTEEVVKIR